MKTVDYTNKQTGAVADRHRWMDADGSKHTTVTRYEVCPKCGRIGRPLTLTASGIRQFTHRRSTWALSGLISGLPGESQEACIVVPTPEAAR